MRRGADRPEEKVYKASGDERLYIEDTDWYDEERLHYINELMKNPGAENQYYFATIVQFGNWHIGVLLNDSTKEMIEFHAELRVDAVPHIGRLYWRHKDFLEDTHRTSYCQDLPGSVSDTEYYVFEEDSIYKSGYRVAFSAEDYTTVKQERMEYYLTALFDSEYADDYVGERYVYSDDHKQYLNSINLEDKRIDYLDVLLTEEKGDFYLGCSRFKDHEEKCPCFRYQYDAVLFNDKTHEIIELSYNGPLDMPIDSGEEETSLLDLVAVIFLLFLRLSLPILVEAGIAYLIVRMFNSRKRTRIRHYEKSEPDFYDFMDFPDEK